MATAVFEKAINLLELDVDYGDLSLESKLSRGLFKWNIFASALSALNSAVYLELSASVPSNDVSTLPPQISLPNLKELKVEVYEPDALVFVSSLDCPHLSIVMILVSDTLRLTRFRVQEPYHYLARFIERRKHSIKRYLMKFSGGSEWHRHYQGIFLACRDMGIHIVETSLRISEKRNYLPGTTALKEALGNPARPPAFIRFGTPWIKLCSHNSRTSLEDYTYDSCPFTFPRSVLEATSVGITHTCDLQFVISCTVYMSRLLVLVDILYHLPVIIEYIPSVYKPTPLELAAIPSPRLPYQNTMSLPPAKRDISEHPPKDAVTAPVDKAFKEQDIRLYGAVEAFRHGRLPTNRQLDEGLRYVQENSPVDVEDLSPEGRKLINDSRDIINTLRAILQEKNADELLQNFIWHTRDIDTKTLAPGDSERRVPVDRDTAQAESQEAAKHLRALFHIVLTNSEARKLLSDFSVIGRDLLSKTASKAATNIAPTEEQLRRADEAAPENQFITEGGRRVGPEETPVLEARLPGTDTTVRRDPHEDEAFVHPSDGERRPVSDVRREGASRATDVAEEASRRAPDLREEVRTRAREHAEDVQESQDPEAEVQAKRTGFMGKMKDMTQNFTDRIPAQHKDRAQDHYERGRQYLSEEYFPEERRGQFIFRMKKVVLECQRHDDYQTSIRWLLDYVEHYANYGREMATTHGTRAQSAFTDQNVDLSLREVRTLLERFANNTPLTGVIDAANVLIDDSKRDPALRRWFKDVDAYIRRVLVEPGYILDKTCNEDGRRLREDGRYFYDEKYRTEFDDLFNNVSSWFKAMGDDPLNKQFGEDWARLTKDLLFDNEGTLKFKPELWNDIRKVILPQVIEKIGYVPIPRIEYTDDSLDLVLENLALQGRNLFPNIISLEANNYIKFSPYNAITDDNHHHITLHLEQMQADMRDIAFYYRTKSGLKMTDSGIADVLLGGRGLSSKIVLRSTTRDKSSVFKVHEVTTKVDSLKFSIRDAKHNILYKTVKPLATGLVKKQIEKAIRDALVTGLEYIDGQLVSVRDRMENAKETEGKSRTDVLKEMFQHKKKDTESKIEEKPKHFKVVANKRDSLLAPVGHPSGWVNLTDEREKAAVRGEEWRSDAFDLVPRARDTREATAQSRATETVGRAPTESTHPAAPTLNTTIPGPEMGATSGERARVVEPAHADGGAVNGDLRGHPGHAQHNHREAAVISEPSTHTPKVGAPPPVPPTKDTPTLALSEEGQLTNANRTTNNSRPEPVN
ncbi:hypothetical protein NP233_g9389 [Leucocoprinus birnbaumii]|uniref:Uncharacterized protein n=1 Tax=Leucocoprinus birnbaumii TaxID=56174 RepID=A0AAD5VKP0_9AGAR|nr:hypothetical protein NP233_g9389 [Leucocoprinus birnbaumii]